MGLTLMILAAILVLESGMACQCFHRVAQARVLAPVLTCGQLMLAQKLPGRSFGLRTRICWLASNPQWDALAAMESSLLPPIRIRQDLWQETLPTPPFYLACWKILSQIPTTPQPVDVSRRQMVTTQHFWTLTAYAVHASEFHAQVSWSLIP